MEEQLESKFPEDWRKDLEGLHGEELSVNLSRHRTHMSTYRTELSNARSHMSNERTHLSYLRTSLSLLTFGVTLNRFSIYLRESKTESNVHLILYETQYVGLGMVLLGIGILSWALYRYRKVSNEIDNHTYSSPQQSLSLLTLAIIMIGGFTAFWMIVNQVPGD